MMVIILSFILLLIVNTSELILRYMVYDVNLTALGRLLFVTKFLPSENKVYTYTHLIWFIRACKNTKESDDTDGTCCISIRTDCKQP